MLGAAGKGGSWGVSEAVQSPCPHHPTTLGWHRPSPAEMSRAVPRASVPVLLGTGWRGWLGFIARGGQASTPAARGALKIT